MRLFMMTITFLFAVIACFMVNVAAPNGQTAFAIVSRFPVPISPSPIVLFFWLVVYGAIAYWLLTHAQKRTSIPTLYAILFNLAMLSHALTFFSWQQQFFYISVLFALVATLLLFYMYTTFYKHSAYETISRIPISLAISFFSCLLLWEAAFTITYIEWDGFGLSEQLWGMLLLTIALTIGTAIRYLYDDPYFLIAYAWLYVCIVIAHHFNNLFISSVALFLLFVVIIAMKYGQKSSSL